MEKSITVASRKALLGLDNVDNLGDWLRRVPCSRADFIWRATDILYAYHEWGGSLVTGEGERIAINAGVFDDVHSEYSDGEWISEQRRRMKAQRAPRTTLLLRFQVYDGLAVICGRPIGLTARRLYVDDVRKVLQYFSPIVRIRYVRELQKLRNVHRDDPVLLYAASVHRLRVRYALEQADRNESNG